MDKNKIENLKNKIKETHQKFYSAYDSLDELNNMFVYKGFEYRPVIDLNDDMDFILFYNNLYLYVADALTIMEQNGFIEPANFESY
jgi:hypothetical protein